LAAELRSLQRGHLAVLGAISIGQPAIAILRELLFERERRIFEPRRRAVRALAGLGANDALEEFLLQWRSPSDPVERMGDEAVLSAAAREVARSHDEGVFEILRAVAQHNAVPGVLEGLSE